MGDKWALIYISAVGMLLDPKRDMPCRAYGPTRGLIVFTPCFGLQEIQQYVQKETAGASHTDPFEVQLTQTA